MTLSFRLPPALRLSYRSRWLYWLLLPWMVPLFAYLLLGPQYWSCWQSLLYPTLFLWLLASGWILGLDRAAEAVVRRFPDLGQTLPRVLLTTAACSLLTALFLAVVVAVFLYVQPFGSTLTFAGVRAGLGVLPQVHVWLREVAGLSLPLPDVSLLLYAIDFIGILVIAIIYEVFYSLGKWHESKMNTEGLRKANMQGQLQSLKNQINPHFLFNSLNSLSSLIADEPERAERFVDEMANVYRYLLQTSEQPLTPLAVELGFIESYYHLLKTRHGPGLQLHVRVAEQYLDYQLPPLTLQMLVENAVKHNVILDEEPLRIDIVTTPAGRLQVSNNLQRKTTQVKSNNVGLPNIRARYELLAQAAPVVQASEGQFVVLLPLLAAE
ncbi:histidine kinase [Hymenobacter sp. ASUV-10]|uniref:Histidine kinase n=1 Tax=Hymenobacter aranciens TaxID=3063996 RepID=A0ABT9B7Y6_9BACT|nr:histidine kinase [Hymenobacter sp. ASUV-10]MDO7874386.1 histidine kinase [Hymenobacter sp. ASUV-10]